MREDELKAVGRQWLRVVELVRREGIADEHNHVRFRDSDLSIKGAALLGFAGLTLAADLVFLSADPQSFIAPDRSCGAVGFAALFVLVAGALCAVASILISRTGAYESAWSSFGLMKIYHDRRRRWLKASAALTCLGTLMYLMAMAGLIGFGRCAIF